MERRKGLELKEGVVGILIFAIIAILIVCFVTIFSNLNSNFDTDNTARTIVNETTSGVVKEAGVLLAGSTYKNFAGCTKGVCINSTDGVVVPSANYTLDASTCRVSYSGASAEGGLNNTIWKCTYSFTYSEETASSNATSSFLTTTANILPLAGILLTVILMALIIGTIIVFGLKQKEGVN